jgi:hypothetical protein
LAAFQGTTVNLTDQGDPERLIASTVTTSMFRVLGLQPIVGRPFGADDERPGSDRVALLAESLWRGRFGGDPSIVGQAIMLNGEPHQVIGVVPREFRHLGRAWISSSGDPQLFLPLAIDPARERRGNHVLRVVGRLGPGVSVEQARDEMDTPQAWKRNSLQPIEAGACTWKRSTTRCSMPASGRPCSCFWAPSVPCW